MMARGRDRRISGEDRALKLNWKKVRAIRSRYRPREYGGTKRLATKYGISNQMVRDIVKGIWWREEK